MRRALLSIAAGLATGILVALLWYGAKAPPNAAAGTDGETMEPASPVATPATTRREQPGPPRFTAAPPTKLPLQNDPLSPDYDVVALANATGALYRDIFPREPKLAKWAEAVQEQFRFFLTKDLESTGIKAQVANVDCRSRTCEVVIQADTEQDLAKATIMVQYTPLANVMEMGTRREPGPARAYTFAFQGDYKNVTYWNVSYPQRRNQRLDELAAKVTANGGKLPDDYPPLPAKVPPPEN